MFSFIQLFNYFIDYRSYCYYYKNFSFFTFLGYVRGEVIIIFVNIELLFFLLVIIYWWDNYYDARLSLDKILFSLLLNFYGDPYIFYIFFMGLSVLVTDLKFRLIDSLFFNDDVKILGCFFNKLLVLFWNLTLLIVFVLVWVLGIFYIF